MIDERTWLNSVDPKAMLDHLCAVLKEPSNRKLLLLAICLERHFTNLGENPDKDLVLAKCTAGELLADGLATHVDVFKARCPLSTMPADWTVDTGLGCMKTWVEEEPGGFWMPGAAEYAVNQFREVFGNPFRPVIMPPVTQDVFYDPYSGSYATMSDEARAMYSPTSLTGSVMFPQSRDRARFGRTVTGRYVWLEWNDRTIPRLAEHVYRTQDYSTLPQIHDALLEAGCDNQDLLWHLLDRERCPEPECFGKGGWWGMEGEEWENCSTCKGEGTIPLRSHHTRGCFAIDLLVEKT